MTLFDQLYEGAEELIKKLQKPLIERQIKRKLQSAYDDAEGKINDSELKISNHRKKLNEYNINVVLEEKQMIQKHKTLQEAIKKEYKELFNEELK